MKRILFIALMLIANTSIASSFSHLACADIPKERERIRIYMREHPYTIKEGERLDKKSSELLAEYNRRCKNYEEGEGLYTVVGAKQREFVNPFTQHRMTGASSYAFFYSSAEKQNAWQQYYKLHPSCRVKNGNNSDFIRCTEDKAQQREAFEKTWEVAFNSYKTQLAENNLNKSQVIDSEYTKLVNVDSNHAAQASNYLSNVQHHSPVPQGTKPFFSRGSVINVFIAITILFALSLYTWFLVKYVKRK